MSIIFKKVLADRVVIEPLKKELAKKNGIIVPDTAKERIKKGVVVGVGESVKELNKDDKVIYGAFAGVEVEINGVTYIVMKESEVFLVL